MESMIAYCGLNCQTCLIHLATLETDPKKQGAMRTEIARVCTEQYAMDIRVQDVTDCDGCSATTGRLFSGCAKCEIRGCAIERNVASCAFCDEFACEKLRKHFESDPSARTRLETMRASNPPPGAGGPGPT